MAHLIDKDWIATSLLTGFPIGGTLSIQNAGRAGDLVELILSSSEPSLTDRGYVVRNIDPLYRVSGQSVELWIRYIRYDLTGTITPQAARKCLVNISDNEQISEASSSPESSGSVKVVTDTAKTAFDELKAERNTPVTQISAQNGLLQNVLTVTDSIISGTNSVIDKKFTCESGTSASGLASILSLRQISSRSGQGILARFSSIFGTPVANNNQAAGLITAENSFTFGYIGNAFGIISVHDGLDELQELTLTVAASGSETATVTIDGTPYSVSLTGNGIANDAYEISTDLNINVPNYNFTSNGSTVIAQAIIPEPMGSFGYSSDGDSSGAWVQIEVGTEGTLTFIPQSDWNFDTRLTGDSDRILNPLFNNDYQIQLDGAVDFFVSDRNTKKPILVHRMSFVNESTDNNPANSTFRVGWISRNVGNTTNVIIQGGKAGLFNEGQIYYDTIPRGESNSQSVPANASIQTTVLILRNRLSFAGAVNRAEVLPLIISGSTESNKFAEFRLLLDPVFSSPVNFSYVDKTSSIIEVSRDSVLVTGGREIGSLIVEAGTPQERTFNQTEKTTTAVYPGAVIAIVATLQSGGAGACQVSATFQEDL